MPDGRGVVHMDVRGVRCRECDREQVFHGQLMTSEHPTYDALDDALKAKVDAIVADLEIQPAGYQDATRYLLAMVAVRTGLLRVVERGAREGRPGVVLVDERQEALYWVADPPLGERAEAEIVGLLADALGIGP